MTFKKIKPDKRRRLLGLPSVRFAKGQLFFSSEAVRNYLKGVEFLELSWDAENLKVGILPLKKESKDSFRVRIYRKDKSPVGAVSAPSLFKEIEKEKVLEDKKVKTFLLKKEGNLLVIDLKSGSEQ